jgi:hypothetical protein
MGLLIMNMRVFTQLNYLERYYYGTGRSKALNSLAFKIVGIKGGHWYFTVTTKDVHVLEVYYATKYEYKLIRAVGWGY